MKLIAVDPGLTSGLATYDTNTGAFNVGEYERVVLLRAVEARVWSAKELPLHERPVLVVERYTITARTAKLTQQSEALRIIGALEYLADTGQCSMHISPTSRKKFSSNAKLKALGWFRGGEGHGDDAARHLLAYLATIPEGAALLERLAA